MSIDDFYDYDELLENVGEDYVREWLSQQMPKNIIKMIYLICKEIRPKAYYGKEEVKQLICDYIDNNMIKALNNENYD